MSFKARFGSTLITGFASLYGMPVGIIANNGIYSLSLHKKAHTSLSYAHSAIFHCYSYKTLRVLWLVASMKMKGLQKRANGDGSCNRKCTETHPNYVARLVQVTTVCVAALIHHAFYGHGRTLVFQ